MKRRRSSTALYPEATRRSLLLVNYYERLNEHAPFQAALRALYRDVLALRATETEDEQSVLDQERRLLEQFAATWHLPLERGVDDVQYSIALAHEGLSLLLSRDPPTYWRP